MRRSLSIVGLLSLCTPALAQPVLPAPDGDRTNPAYVPWQIDESRIDAATFDQRRAGDPRISDFEFVPARIASSSGILGNSFDINTYFTAEIANQAPFANSEIRRIGPGVPSVVIQAMRDQDLRPIDIEVRPFVDIFGTGNSVISQRMMATAVPNPPRAGGAIQWDILLDRTQNEVDSLALQNNPALRPMDIEYSGPVMRGPLQFRGYAVLAVENEAGRPLGEFDWDIKWNQSDFALAAFQTEPIGRLVDFEIYAFRDADNTDARYDAILYDWQGVPRESQIVSVPGQLGRLFGDADADPDTEQYLSGRPSTIPLFTAGYRPIDIEYTWARPAFSSDQFIHANAAVIDAPTGLQQRVRDALDAVAVDFARNTNEVSGLDIKEIGGQRFESIHPRLRTGGNIGADVPAYLPFLAAYAYLFDDVTLTEQQLNTCFPQQCPVPDGVCDPQQFTVAELVDRTLDLQDISAASTLIENRYTLPNVVGWIETIVGLSAVGFDNPDGFFIADELCDSAFRLDQMSELTEQLADGTLASGQLRDDILAALFDDDASLRAAIGAVIDDEAAETDLAPAAIDQFKQALGVGHRTLTRDATNGPNPTLRVLSTNLLSVPVCGTGGAIVSREFAVTAFVETESLDPAAPDAAVAESLRDAIADALDGWKDCATPICLADTNGDGVVTPADFNGWILAFNSQSPACDQNGDGLCTPADFNGWILNYNAGC